MAGPMRSLLKARFMPHMGKRVPCRWHSQQLWASVHASATEQVAAMRYLGDGEHCIHIARVALLGLHHLCGGVVVRDVQPEAWIACRSDWPPVHTRVLVLLAVTAN